MRQFKEKYIWLLHKCSICSVMFERILENRIITKVMNTIWILANGVLFLTGIPYRDIWSAIDTVAVLVGTTYIGVLLGIFAVPLIIRALSVIIYPFVLWDERISGEKK